MWVFTVVGLFEHKNKHNSENGEHTTSKSGLQSLSELREMPATKSTYHKRYHLVSMPIFCIAAASEVLVCDVNSYLFFILFDFYLLSCVSMTT